MSLYSDASVYDILHSPGTASEIDGLLRAAARFLDANRLSILEPACGSGRYLRVLAGRGHRVVGFDIDEGMVAYAHERFERAGLTRRARVLQLEMERCADALMDATKGRRFDLAFNLINTIRHLETDRAMTAHLREIASVLTPRGVYLVGLSLSSPHEQSSEDFWDGRRGRCHVRQLVSYLPPASPRDRREQVLSHLTIETPSETRYADASYWLRTYTLAQWDRLVRAGGMEIAGVFDEAGEQIEPAAPGYAVFALQAAT